jgi:PTS system fructose-specific IIC component
MKITDLLSKATIDIKVTASSKEDVIKKAVALIAKSGAITDVETYEKGVFKREEESTTGIGEGIAIPHCKSEVVSKPALAAMVIKDGVDYASLDGEPVQLLFLIAAPNTEDNVHLDVLARLSNLLMNEDFKNNLLAAKSKEAFLKVIDEAEGEKLEEAKKENGPEFPRLLAVTACPTGIAHTYMAEQALKDKAKEMGISIKVETNGSGGIKNAITAEEIDHAEGVIIAADAAVDVDRFAGKRVVRVAVAKGIHEPERLIKEALDPSTPIFKAGEERKVARSEGKESVAHQIYRHLMNGVSHMLPFVIGGGILIALAFLIDTIAGNAGSAAFGSVNPVAAWFKNVGGYAFGFMVWVLAGFIAHSITHQNKGALAVGMVGGYIATTTNFNILASIQGENYALSASAGFLGGIVAGFAAGYIVIGLNKLFSFLPKSLESLKATLIVPVLGTLCIGLTMYLVNTPLIYVNIGFSNMLNWLAEHNLTILLCALLGAMMAIDMGGPINKAAYVFAVGSLASASASGYMIMAAVMAGGMVPPLGIAISAHLFPHKYSKAQRRDAYVNYVMGASFITEGAIPFAASDPWRVILSSVVGSAVAGLFSGLFGCQLLAPHGGVFVLATIQPSGWTILLYLLAIIIGSFVTAFMLGLLKKDAENPELGKWKGIHFPWKK